jgi:hypothetical protein
MSAGAQGTPRWVKVFAALALIAVVAVIVLLATGKGHTPRRHALPLAAALR